MADFLSQNWQVIIVVAILIAGVIYTVIKQPKKIKEWLVWACSKAETMLGSGTGMLKLRAVYDMFIAQFPIVSKFVSFKTFQKWTEESLTIFKGWVNGNVKAEEIFPTIVAEDEKNEEN